MDSPTETISASDFRTPPRILIPKLVRSRDQWKAKATARKRQYRQEKIHSRDLESSRERWKEGAGCRAATSPTSTATPCTERTLRRHVPELPNSKRTRKKLTTPEAPPPPPRGGHYSCSLISFFLDLYLETSASLRCAASAFAVFVRHFHLDLPVPSFTTFVRFPRLGRHALVRPLPGDVPWLWIIDHTIQIGAKKLFLIVGCPLSDVPFGQRSLSLTDLHLIALVPMEQSNQYLVDDELKKASQRTGPPRLIVSDQGPDLVKGIEHFQQRHANTAAVGDVAHYGANVLENRWERDPRWVDFSSGLPRRISRSARRRMPFCCLRSCGTRRGL